MTLIDLQHAQEAAEALTTLPAATVHEAYGRRGALDPAIKPVAPGQRVCAPVMTVRTVPGSNLLIHQALYRTPPGWVLLAATEGCRRFGYWGDVMTMAAIHRGLSGVVLDGGVRDLAELRASSLPIFAAGHSLRGTVKVQEGDIGEPISVGGVIARPGDIIIGDDDGTVCVPLELAHDVAAKARAREHKETAIKEELAHGRTTLEIYGFAEGPTPAAQTPGFDNR